MLTASTWDSGKSPGAMPFGIALSWEVDLHQAHFAAPVITVAVLLIIHILSVFKEWRSPPPPAPGPQTVQLTVRCLDATPATISTTSTTPETTPEYAGSPTRPDSSTPACSLIPRVIKSDRPAPIIRAMGDPACEHQLRMWAKNAHGHNYNKTSQ